MALTNPAVATAVINEALAHKILAQEIPPTDDAKLALANQVLTQAEIAKKAGVQSAAIIAVLNAAAQESGASAEANPFAPAAPAAAPAPVPVPPVPAAAPPVPAPAPAAPVAPPVPAAPAVPEGVTIDTAIPGYTSLSTAQILEAMEKLNDAGINFVKQYELDNDERPKILNFVKSGGAPAAAPAAPAPVATPAAPVPAAPDATPGEFNNVEQAQYASVEPWQGYTSDKIPAIVSRLEAVYGTEDGKARLAHVWEFEHGENGKKRKTLATKLTDLAQNGVQQPAAAAPAPAAPAAPVAPEPDDVKPESPFTPTPAAAPAPAPAPEVSLAVPADLFANTTGTGVSTEFEDVVAPLDGNTQRAAALVAREFPAPAPVSNIPEIPADFATLNDSEVTRYQGIFNAVQARLLHLNAQAEGHEQDAKNAAEVLIEKFIRENQFDPKVVLAEKKALASQSTEVQHARHVEQQWKEVARQYDAAIDYYDATCRRLSREQTKRADEHGNVR